MARRTQTNLGHAKALWRIVRTISVAEIEREAGLPVRIALVGADAARAEGRAALCGPSAAAANPYLHEYRSTAAADGFPHEGPAFDLVIDAGQGRIDPPQGAVLLSRAEVGTWADALQRILEVRPDLEIALARRFPGLRDLVCARVIGETATANAQIAMLNALPGVVPALTGLLPTALLGDMVMLTKNQAAMMLRLAAVYDLAVDPRARVRDIAPLLASAFGWRAVARELVAVVPGGVGLAARGGIAYSGTYTLGKAIQRVYALGEQPTRAQLRVLYREAWGKALGVVASLRRTIADRRRGLPPAP